MIGLRTGRQPLSRRERAAIILLLALSCLVALLPRDVAIVLVIAELAILVRAVIHVDENTIRSGILLVLLSLCSIIPQTQRWPLVFLLPGVLFLIGRSLNARLRGQGQVWPVGRLDIRSWTGVLLLAAISILSLLAWINLAKPELTSLSHLIPPYSGLLLLGTGVGFALFNATLEETLWRGFIFGGFRDAGFSVGAANVMQAASFGCAHLHGFPKGALGVVLASIYGLLVGLLRAQTTGLLAPVISHALTDFAIFLVLVQYH